VQQLQPFYYDKLIRDQPLSTLARCTWDLLLYRQGRLPDTLYVRALLLYCKDACLTELLE
jgi:hypothetical protein